MADEVVKITDKKLIDTLNKIINCDYEWETAKKWHGYKSYMAIDKGMVGLPTVIIDKNGEYEVLGGMDALDCLPDGDENEVVEVDDIKDLYN